ncbi:peptidylprolyl isomerase [Sphingomonas sp. TF3]|uniref:FKBP-type peptidyl-prolyl cis-trans isomerase n=1 Tax=unclassified Sphingomonas TaxID=196159 RepID=UPI000F86D5BA|nr:FKBP-type peptidyl-prolyl cis-trans isomerase [Sphingomonas sp. TF3]RUN76477.1 peptidylprolyl isomerase [Sphingomonas sp. TF3]
MRAIAFAAGLAALLLTSGIAQARVKKPLPRRAQPVAAVPVTADAFLAANARVRGVIQTPSGLQYRVVKPGTGTEKPGDGDVALVNYVGKLTNGTTFDKSAQPTPLPVAGLVPGFAEALKAMPRGAQYRVWIKPSLGYGEAGSGPIPPKSVLVFDIDLIDFISQAAFDQLRQQQPADPKAAPSGQ